MGDVEWNDVAAAVFLLRTARAEIACMDAERAHRVARNAWHRASSRASCERVAVHSGCRGRCGCEDCEADPLGFFGPYRKSTNGCTTALRRTETP